MNSAEITKEIAIQKRKENIEYLEQETKQKISREIDHFISEVVNEVTKNESTVKQLTNIFNNNYEITDKVKVSNGRLPEKVFVTRNSLLSELFTIKHIRTIYHIFLAMLVGQFIHTAVDDYLRKGQIIIGFDKLLKGFSKLDMVAMLWAAMFTLILAIHPFFKFWANTRTNLMPNSVKLKLWDYSWVCLTIFYYALFIYYFSKAVVDGDFPPPSAAIVLCELSRLMMKSYAFTRSNVSKVLNHKPHSDEEDPCPSFQNFFYFLFVPTLVYRDSYPRTRTIRWKVVLFYFIEFVGVIFYMFFLLDRYFIAVFQNYGKEKINWKEVALHVLGNSPAGGAYLASGFYILLHVWMNAFAEILRFGDRMFYKDWWNCTSYGLFYKKWNVVVYDWLYTYIYKDISESFIPINKVVAKFLVFFISAFVHEYILSLAFGFFLPVLFMEFFGFGGAIVFVSFRENFCGNIFLWLTISFGMCLSMSMYCIEYFVRINCPIENSTYVDFFIPRLFTCDRL